MSAVVVMRVPRERRETERDREGEKERENRRTEGNRGKDPFEPCMRIAFVV